MNKMERALEASRRLRERHPHDPWGMRSYIPGPIAPPQECRRFRCYDILESLEI